MFLLLDNGFDYSHATAGFLRSFIYIYAASAVDATGVDMHPGRVFVKLTHSHSHMVHVSGMLTLVARGSKDSTDRWSRPLESLIIAPA